MKETHPAIPPHALQFLRTESILRSVPPKALDVVLAQTGYKHYRRGDVLFHEGDAADVVWFLLSGWVRLSRFTRDGEEKVLLYRTKGETVGEAGLFLEGRQDCVAEAYEDLAAAVVGRADIHGLIEDHPALMRSFLRLAVADRTRLMDDLVGVSANDTRRRLIFTLLGLAERYGKPEEGGSLRLVLPMTQHELASIVGTTRETISRLCSGIPELHFEQRNLFISGWDEFLALHR